MYKRIKLDKNGEIKVPLYNGIKSSINQDGEISKKIVSKSFMFTDGDVFLESTKRISRHNPNFEGLPFIEQETVKRMFMEYANIDMIEISYIVLQEPSFYIDMTLYDKKEKNYKGKSIVLEDIQTYAVKPLGLVTMGRIKKTYNDIQGLVINNDASMLTYFLERDSVFRLNYEEVKESVYQLKI